MSADTPVEQNVAEATPVVVEPFVADPSKHAFVTMAIIDESYVVDALTLGHSIRASGSKASLVVMVSSNISQTARDALAGIYTTVMEVPVIVVKIPKVRTVEQKLAKFMRFAFTKLHMFTLTQYEKVMYIDADSICLTNPDNVFGLDTPAGICHVLLKTEKATVTTANVIPHKIFDKASREQGINGNAYLITPDQADFDRAIKTMTPKIKVNMQPIVKKADRLLAQSVKQSKFAFLANDDEDEDDENVDNKKENTEPERKTRTLTAEELEATRFGDEEDINDKFPFAVFTPPNKVLGLQFGEGRKATMGYDEMLIMDLLKGQQWRHLPSVYGRISWRATTPRKGSKTILPEAPVFVHFTKQVWKEKHEYDDFVFFYMSAISLVESSSSSNAIDYIKQHVTALPAKIQARNEGTYALPVFSTPESEAEAQAQAAAAAAAVAPADSAVSGPEDVHAEPILPQAASASAPEQTTTTTTTGPKLVPAPVPTKTAWGQ